jgi:hypothetical protein
MHLTFDFSLLLFSLLLSSLALSNTHKSYEKIEDEEGSYIKVYDSGRKLDLHLIHGFLKTKIVSFVMNLHTVPRQASLSTYYIYVCFYSLITLVL